MYFGHKELNVVASPVLSAWIMHLEMSSSSLPPLWGKRFYLQLTDVQTEAQKCLETTQGHTVSKRRLDSSLGLAIPRDQLLYMPRLPPRESKANGKKKPHKVHSLK